MNYQTTNDMNEIDAVEVDLFDLIRLLWRRLWMIGLSMIVCGVIAFSVSVFAVTPSYSASAMMFVNNGSASVSGIPITFNATQLSAARSLLDTYVVILKTRTTLEAAIEKADLDYSYAELKGIVSAEPVDDTDIFRITATCADPDDAKLIVDTLVEILPDRIATIVDGSSVRLVDRAVRPTARLSPSYTRYAFIGVIVGMILSCAGIIIEDLMNTTVRDEEYLKQRYNIPILAVVPKADIAAKKMHRYEYGSHDKSGHNQITDENGYAKSYERARTGVGGDK